MSSINFTFSIKCYSNIIVIELNTGRKHVEEPKSSTWPQMNKERFIDYIERFYKVPISILTYYVHCRLPDYRVKMEAGRPWYVGWAVCHKVS